MKLTKAFLVMMTFFVLAIGLAFYAKMGLADPVYCENGQTLAAGCGKCGDGYCNPRCGENEKNCPRDCGVTSETK